MKQLVFETSTNRAIIALLNGSETVLIEKFFGGPGLSEQLAPTVARLLTKYSFMPEKIVVGVGPGSFTGIRVGCSLAQALSFGWQIPLFTTSSLAAFLPDKQEPLAAIIDARSAGFYVQLQGSNIPILISAQKALDLFPSVQTFTSPHVEKIQERFAPEGAKWLDLWPDPCLLAKNSLLHNDKTTLAPYYAPKGDLGNLLNGIPLLR